MTIDELADLLGASQKQMLTPAQKLVLFSSWEGKTYAEMVATSIYDLHVLKTTAADLWQAISNLLGIPIMKGNLRQTLAGFPLSPSQAWTIAHFRQLQMRVASMASPGENPGEWPHPIELIAVPSPLAVDHQEVQALRDRVAMLERENHRLHQLVYTDELTGLFNRRYFNQYFQQECYRLGAVKKPIALILCDLDFFKIYNESFGRLAGDDCLQQVATVIQTSIQPVSAVAARYEGEEFAIIIPDMDGVNPVRLADNIRQKVKALEIPNDESRLGGVYPFITVSMGVACRIPDAEGTPKLLFSDAEDALSMAKKTGRDRVFSSGDCS